jgi:uncharacterized membrane protein
MSDEPVQVIVAVFQSEQGADSVLYDLEAARAAGYYGIQNAAVLRRDKDGKLQIQEKKDWGGGEGAAAGAIVGAIVGAITGPGAVLVGAAGAAIGGLAAKLRDSGFDDGRLKTLGESLTPGTSALVAVVEHKRMAEYEAKLVQASGDSVTETVAAEIAQRLVLDGEVIYSALGTEESIVLDDVDLQEIGAEGSGDD